MNWGKKCWLLILFQFFSPRKFTTRTRKFKLSGWENSVWNLGCQILVSSRFFKILPPLSKCDLPLQKFSRSICGFIIYRVHYSNFTQTRFQLQIRNPYRSFVKNVKKCDTEIPLSLHKIHVSRLFRLCPDSFYRQDIFCEFEKILTNRFALILKATKKKETFRFRNRHWHKKGIASNERRRHELSSSFFINACIR